MLEILAAVFISVCANIQLKYEIAWNPMQTRLSRGTEKYDNLMQEGQEWRLVSGIWD